MDPDPDKQLKNVLEWIISWMEWYFSKAPEKIEIEMIEIKKE